MAGIQIERFVSINRGKKPMYWPFGTVALIVLFAAAITGNSEYLEAGFIVIIGIAAMRFGSLEIVFGTEIRFPFLASGMMAFLSAASLALGLTMLSTFLYLGALILLIVTVAENIMSIT